MNKMGFIDFYAEKIKKAVSAFSTEDWKNAALIAGSRLDELTPLPKKRGRPRKPRPTQNVLANLVLHGQKTVPAKRVGRPYKTFGKNGSLTYADIAELIDAISKECQKSDMEAARMVLRRLGGHSCYAASMLRSVRKFRK